MKLTAKIISVLQESYKKKSLRKKVNFVKYKKYKINKKDPTKRWFASDWVYGAFFDVL